MPVGTIVDYSRVTDIIHFVKILSGEKLVTLYPADHPTEARMGALVEYDVKKNEFTVIGR